MAQQTEKKLRKGYKLTKLEGEDNFYVDAYDGLIVYRKNINKIPLKIFTPFAPDKIKKARDFVAQELLKRSGKTKMDVLSDQGIENPSVKEAYDECVDERKSKKAESTLLNYQVSWDHGIEGFWGDKTVKDITQANIKKFEDWYINNRSDRTFFNARKCFVMLINYLWENGKLRHENKRPKVADLDFDVLNYRRKKKKAGRRYTDDETEALIECAISQEIRVAIKIYRFMGPRKMELMSSKRADVDLIARTISFYSSKNKKWRLVPMPAVVYQDLKQYMEDTAYLKSEFLFPAPTNTKRHMVSQVFDSAWTETKRQAEIVGWDIKNAARVHDLRHTFATDTAELGWPIRVACDILDMSSDEYERTYTDHISKDIKVRLMLSSFAGWKI